MLSILALSRTFNIDLRNKRTLKNDIWDTYSLIIISLNFKIFKLSKNVIFALYFKKKNLKF